MNIDSTYRFLLFDLLTVIDKIKVAYHHDAYPDIEEHGTASWPTGESTWGMGLTSISGFSGVDNYQNRIYNLVNRTISHLKENRMDFPFFLEPLSDLVKKKLKKLEDAARSITGFTAMIEDGEIILQYEGIREEGDFLNFGSGVKINWPTTALDSQEKDDYQKIFRLATNYLQVLSYELRRLVLYMEHEEYLISQKEEGLKRNNVNPNYAKLLKLGKYEELLKLMDEDPRYQYNEYFVHCSSKFHKLESDNLKQLVDGKTYNIRYSEITNILLQLIINRKID